MTHGPTVFLLALYLGAPLALEAPKAFDLKGLPAPYYIGSSSRAAGISKGLMDPKEPHWFLGAPCALVTDETFWNHETCTQART